MNPTDSVKTIVLQPDASYYDWRDAAMEARLFYVISACQACEVQKLGKAKAGRVMAGINLVYEDPQCRTLPLSKVFGLAFSKVRKI